MTEPIRLLDDLTIARIAAGEVVERPASVVKELVENSLDAGATDIRVEIAAGGRRLVRVTDNGRGIPPAEAALAFQKHATSKIRSSADLDRIASLGFRGEALASIASVAQVTLVTRAAGERAGMRLRVENGRRVEETPVGAAPGTVVTVENLFHAVPARLKFLRNDHSEAGHIQDLVVHYALAYPDRAFTLIRDGRTVFQAPGTGELEDTLIAAFGLDVAREMLALGAEAGLDPDFDPVLDPAEDGLASPAKDPEPSTIPPLASDTLSLPPPRVRVRGYVSPPHLHRATRRHITLFVNGRWVRDSQLGFAVIQAYHTLLPKGRFPIAVILLELPSESVDVNVHPAKTELRFRDGRPVFAAVQRAVRSAVIGQAPVAPAARGAADEAGADWPIFPARPRPLVFPGGGARPFESSPSSPRSPAPEARQAGFLDEGGRLPMLRLIGQLGLMYLVAEGPEGLYLIDQHAAHERVMYERFMARRAPATSQPLLAPEAVALSPAQLGVVEDQAGLFAGLGFAIEPFGPDTVLVRALPEVLAGATEVAETLRSILDGSLEGGSPIAESMEARLVRAVCKQATVKAGQLLSMAEMQALLRDLEACESPRTCPHGRPTMIVLSAERLERAFGRA